MRESACCRPIASVALDDRVKAWKLDNCELIGLPAENEECGINAKAQANSRNPTDFPRSLFDRGLSREPKAKRDLHR